MTCPLSCLSLLFFLLITSMGGLTYMSREGNMNMKPYQTTHTNYSKLRPVVTK